MIEKMITITYGRESGAHTEPNYCYAETSGLKNNMKVQGTGTVKCITKLLDRIVNPNALEIEFLRNDKRGASL